tara:strand:- start:782 stop:1246 length:465 start_codon:yes stop_codon:yes gene_type:complete
MNFYSINQSITYLCGRLKYSYYNKVIVYLSFKQKIVPPKKLFIVHEDIDVCLLLQYILQVDFKTTVVANSFGMVENYLESQSFEVVLTDVNIDGISRNQYIAYLNDKLPDAKIVVITDMDQGIIEKELFNIGIEQFFDFPLTITELSNALKSSF